MYCKTILAVKAALPVPKIFSLLFLDEQLKYEFNGLYPFS